jgi:hypothetical protein
MFSTVPPPKRVSRLMHAARYWPSAGGNQAALGSLLPGIADRAASPASVSEGTRITLARRGSWTGACTGPGGSASP